MKSDKNREHITARPSDNLRRNLQATTRGLMNRIASKSERNSKNQPAISEIRFGPCGGVPDT